MWDSGRVADRGFLEVETLCCEGFSRGAPIIKECGGCFQSTVSTGGEGLRPAGGFSRAGGSSEPSCETDETSLQNPVLPTGAARDSAGGCPTVPQAGARRTLILSSGARNQVNVG